MPENNQMMSVEGQLVGMPLAGPESFSQQQLDYLKRALGVDETLLYIDTNWSGVTSCTLSEAMSNFEYVDITVGFYGATNGTIVHRFPGSCIALHFIFGAGQGGTDYLIRAYGLVDGTSVSILKAKCMYSTYSVTTADTIRNNADNDMKCIYKVVGVHRIAGGNQ